MKKNVSTKAPTVVQSVSGESGNVYSLCIEMVNTMLADSNKNQLNTLAPLIDGFLQYVH